MATPIRMLRLSKGMEVGRVVTWLKRVGDPVHLEVDILAKHVEKLLSRGGTGAERGTLARTLEEYEYLR